MPVVGFDVRRRRPLAGGRTFGDTGPWEDLRGRLRVAIDPLHPASARITDVTLAPRNSAGCVEMAADVSLLLPVDPSRGHGRVILDVVNRGNTVTVPNFNHATRPVFGPGADPDPPVDVGDGFLMRRGFAVLSCGWQADLPDIPGLLRLHAPEALDGEGRPLRGRVLVQLQTGAPAPHLLLSDRGHQPYPAADVDEPGALMTVHDQLDDPGTPVPRARWRFARHVDGAPVPDERFAWLEGGFEKGRIYRVIYTAVGAPVLGLGFAALRDAVAWLKHGTAADGNPAAGAIQHAYGYGRSQTGRWLRTLAHADLNLDEQGREALDGFIASVAGGMRGEFNQRFGQNSKDRPHLMAHVFPATDVVQIDPETGATDGLHARLDARGSRLKAMYVNSAAEYHRGDASLTHTDPGGERDVSHGPHVRVYHLAGTEHGLGVWPPADTQPAPADPTGAVERSQNVRGTLDYGRLLRACLVRLDDWVSRGVEPPPSRHPRRAEGTAVAPAALRTVFDAIPGARYPRHHAVPRRLDFGPDPAHALALPPRVGQLYGALVSAVDGDGNEVDGIAVPELAVPVATHTGWTLRHPDIGGAEQLLVFAGGTIPFARTRAERGAAGDPRPSIEERYASREEYLARVRAAAVALARDGYLLEEDVDLSVARAARLWDWVVTGAVHV